MSNLSKLLTRGGALVQQGDISGARAEFEKAVRDHGRSVEPWISLAAVHGMSGNYTEALHCARKAVELAPNSLQGWVNLGNAASSCGDFIQSAEAFQRAQGLPGCPPDITLELGLALARLEKWTEAEHALRAYCQHRPGHREATLTLVQALFRKGEFENAITIVEAWWHQHPQDIPALTQLGFLYLEAGRVEDAERACDQAAAASPDELETLHLKAAVLMYHGRYGEARDLYERMARRHQTNPNPRLLILTSDACRQTGDLLAADAYARAAVKLDPRSIPALTTLSSRLLNTAPAEARKWMEAAIALVPNDPAVMALKGRILEFEGDKQGAWEAVRTAIQAGSSDTETAIVAASVAPAIGKSDEVIALLEGLVDRPGIPVGERRTLHFTLARLCDKAKRYDRAFEHAVIANRLKNAWFDHAAHRVDIERLKAVYSQTASGTLPRSRNRSELPVFIVGMPRSGTSLLEQILSCHSQVHTRGETNDVGALVAKMPYYPDGVRDLTPERLDAMAEAHLQRLHQIAPSASRVTDKLPGNYLFAGIISQVLPGARIINCRRDPRDVCLSNFMIEFGRGLTYSYDLESLARVCQDYQELMEHWKAVLPLSILDVRYEELVADPHTWVAKVLDFCGLEWEDACLNFDQSKRQAVTASYDQVRQPLYKSSVARWKHYERHLEPVSRILGLHGDSYP